MPSFRSRPSSDSRRCPACRRRARRRCAPRSRRWHVRRRRSPPGTGSRRGRRRHGPSPARGTVDRAAAPAWPGAPGGAEDGSRVADTTLASPTPRAASRSPCRSSGIMSASKIAWRATFERYASAKPEPAYIWTWPCFNDVSMSNRKTSPSLIPRRPTPHWSIRAAAWASASSVVMPSRPRACV